MWILTFVAGTFFRRNQYAAEAQYELEMIIENTDWHIMGGTLFSEGETKYGIVTKSKRIYSNPKVYRIILKFPGLTNKTFLIRIQLSVL